MNKTKASTCVFTKQDTCDHPDDCIMGKTCLLWSENHAQSKPLSHNPVLMLTDVLNSVVGRDRLKDLEIGFGHNPVQGCTDFRIDFMTPKGHRATAKFSITAASIRDAVNPEALFRSFFASAAHQIREFLDQEAGQPILNVSYPTFGEIES